MDPIKDAFLRIKIDIENLNNETAAIRSELAETRQELMKICEILLNINKKVDKNQEKPIPAHQHINQTTPTHTPTHDLPLKALKGLKTGFSIGNEGVPTDKQTNRQTHNPAHNQQYLIEKNSINSQEKQQISKENTQKNTNFSENYEKYAKNDNFNDFSQKPTNPIEDAAKILESLDSIKKEIRLKFKRLTSQEMLVFSTLYQLEEETGEVDYKALAQRLRLTESSVRDYIGRLIKKGIPVDKKRINNKTILLSVSQNLKKITSLSTIIQLRDL